MNGQYDIIMIDPPWLFDSNSKAKPGRSARRHYDCMPDREIAALPVGDWSTENSFLFVWMTVPMLGRAMDVVSNWGFEYKSQFVWDKMRRGTGYWIQNRHELLMLYKRGAPRWPRKAPFGASVFQSVRREHSRKPDEAYQRIDAACAEFWPQFRKLDVFARQERVGWDAWGNEINKFSGD